MSAYAWIERLPWLDNFLVSLLGSKRSLLNVSLHVVLFTEKCWLVEKCHLNLTFLRMWLKLLTTLKYMALTNVCSHSSVRRWTQSTRLLYTKVRWLSKGRPTGHSFRVMRATPEISFRKTFTTGSTFQWHRMGQKTCMTYSTCSVNSISLQGRRTTVFKSSDKVAAFKVKLELWGWWVSVGIFFICFKH